MLQDPGGARALEASVVEPLDRRAPGPGARRPGPGGGHAGGVLHHGAGRGIARAGRARRSRARQPAGLPRRARRDVAPGTGRVDRPGGPPRPRPLHPATLAICLALVDFETPLWLDAAGRTAEVIAHLRFHCGCPLVDDPARARFAVVADAGGHAGARPLRSGNGRVPRPLGDGHRAGPHALTAGAGRRLTGPGIAAEARLDADGLPRGSGRACARNHGRFPRGVDVLLTAGASAGRAAPDDARGGLSPCTSR